VDWGRDRAAKTPDIDECVPEHDDRDEGVSTRQIREVFDV
jgi:hypothetical protein